jgi:hypothetical protein
MASLEETTRKILHDEKWDVTHQLKLDTSKKIRSAVNACIDSKWVIHINLDKDFENIASDLSKKGHVNSTDPAGDAIYAVVKHEEDHLKKCPMGIRFIASCADGVSSGLARAGFTRDEIVSHSPNVANMFFDTVVNCENYSDGRFVKGIGIVHMTRMRGGALGSFLDFKRDCGYYAMFADAQMKFLGITSDERALVENNTLNYKKFEPVSKALLACLLGDDMAEKSFAGTISEKERESALAKFENYGGWEVAAARYAEIIAPFVKGKLDDMNKKIDPNGTMNDPFKDKDKLREMIRRSRDKGGNAFYATKYDVCDAIYEREAKEIVANFIKSGGEAALSTSISSTRVRRLDKKEMPTRIAWAKTQILGEDMQLFRKETQVSTSNPCEISPGSYKDLLFMIDTSSSMDWSGKPLDNSKYDMCIRSFYGTLKYLEAVHKASYLRYGIMQFSTTTKFSGWKTHSQLDGLKEMLFTNYEDGTTELDPEVVSRAVSTSKDRFAATMISDTDIWNTDEAASACLDMVNRGNEMVILRTKSSNSVNFAELLEKAGVITIDVNDPSELVGLCLNRAKSVYAPIRKTSESEKDAKEGAERQPQLKRITLV